jgi:hypothetical protein
MASGTYGIVRPADITPEDVEIFYSFTASRDVASTGLVRLDNSSDYLIPMNNPNRLQSNISNPAAFEIFGGMYTLKLPTSIFGVKGFYTIMIKPVEIRTRMVDVGVLSAFPDTKGLIFDISSVPTSFTNKFENNGLVGYRIEYLDSNNTKINNFFRLITSNNRSEPVNQNLTNTNQKAIRYRFNDNSTLTFCTVTPSSASNVKPNAFPFIGQPNQQVIITNTFFNPIMIEIEMVQHDIETLAFSMFGNQTKSLDDGIYTIYNFNNDIYKQYNLYEIKDVFTGTPLFEVREERSGIDFSKTFNNITTI